MRFTPVLATTLACANAASARVMRIAAKDVSWSWAVTRWGAGCAEKTCTYDFNVTGVGNATYKPGTPSFKAHCSGEGEGSEFRVCTALEKADTQYVVAAKLLSGSSSTNGTSKPQIQVSIQYTDLEVASTWWNFTGQAEASYNQFEAPLMNFTITPDTIIGVA